MQYLIDNAKWLFEGGSDADDDDEDDAAAADDEGGGSEESDIDVEVKKINSGKGECRGRRGAGKGSQNAEFRS